MSNNTEDFATHADQRLDELCHEAGRTAVELIAAGRRQEAYEHLLASVLGEQATVAGIRVGEVA